MQKGELKVNAREVTMQEVEEKFGCRVKNNKGGDSMSKYVHVCRCKCCGKIYPNGIPYICEKCGAELGYKTHELLQQVLGLGNVTMTDNCEKTVAKRTIIGWKARLVKE